MLNIFSDACLPFLAIIFREISTQVLYLPFVVEGYTFLAELGHRDMSEQVETVLC